MNTSAASASATSAANPKTGGVTFAVPSSTHTDGNPNSPSSSSSSSSSSVPANVSSASTDSTVPILREMVHDSGVQIKFIREGDNIHFPRKGSNVRIHYEARLKVDGVLTPIFDSSRTRNESMIVRVGVGALISGLDQVLPILSRGTRAYLDIPPNRAYGARGYPPIVPPDTVIVYDLEILAIE